MNRLDRRALTSTLLSGVLRTRRHRPLRLRDPVFGHRFGHYTLLGAAVVIAFGFHLSNNLKGLLGYFGKRRRIAFAIGLPATLALLVLLGLPPASTVIDTGYALRNMGGVTDGDFEVIRTRVGSDEGLPLRLSVRAGRHYESDPQPLFLGLTYLYPQMVFWAEDDDGNFLGTLYVTRAISIRASSAPTRSPTRSSAAPKRCRCGRIAVAGPTMTAWLSPARQHRVRRHHRAHAARPLRPRVPSAGRERPRAGVHGDQSLLRLQRLLASGALPGRCGVLGNGSSGQPSLVYMAELDVDAGERFALEPIGHGHHSGRDGSLTPELDGFDTAGAVGPVVVEIDRPVPADADVHRGADRVAGL